MDIGAIVTSANSGTEADSTRDDGSTVVYLPVLNSEKVCRKILLSLTLSAIKRNIFLTTFTIPGDHMKTEQAPKYQPGFELKPAYVRSLLHNDGGRWRQCRHW